MLNFPLHIFLFEYIALLSRQQVLCRTGGSHKIKENKLKGGGGGTRSPQKSSSCSCSCFVTAFGGRTNKASQLGSVRTKQQSSPTSNNNRTSLTLEEKSLVKNEECVIEVSKGASWEKEEALERVLRALLPELEQVNDMFGVKKRSPGCSMG